MSNGHLFKRTVKVGQVWRWGRSPLIMIQKLWAGAAWYRDPNGQWVIAVTYDQEGYVENMPHNAAWRLVEDVS